MSYLILRRKVLSSSTQFPGNHVELFSYRSQLNLDRNPDKMSTGRRTPVSRNNPSRTKQIRSIGNELVNSKKIGNELDSKSQKFRMIWFQEDGSADLAETQG
jgi:hypothetical protein